MKISRRNMMAGTAALVAGGTACYPGIGNERSESESDAGFVEMTDRSKAAVAKGNRWLLKALNRDGGAGLDLNTPSDVACTSVVGMAFLSQGCTAVEGDQWREQKKINEFLLQKVENMGSTGAGVFGNVTRDVCQLHRHAQVDRKRQRTSVRYTENTAH